MIKKTMLAACTAALAFAALPAIASAGVGLEPGEGESFPLHFELHGEKPSLNGPANVNCETVEGTGEFANATSGQVTFEFSGCKGPFGISCTSAGQATGTIVTTEELPFDLVTAEHNEEISPGVLVTPEEGHFASFSCSAFFNIKVGGTGVIGTITEPGYGEASNTATTDFAPVSAGSKSQTHTKVAGDKETYNLTSSVNGGAASASAEDAEGTITFSGGAKPKLVEIETE